MLRKIAKKVVSFAPLSSVALASPAFAAWTVDVSSVSTDVTAVGTSILAIAALILGYKIVKGLVKRG